MKSKRKSILITAFVCAILVISFFIFKHWSVDQKEIRRFAREKAVILDVRTETEFDRGHIPGAVNIRLGKLRTEKFTFDKNTKIITCCSHGLRSIKAVSILKNRGYKQVINGGAWTDLQQCIETTRQ